MLDISSLVKVKKENPELVSQGSQEEPSIDDENIEDEEEDNGENEDTLSDIENPSINTRKISMHTYANRLRFESLDNECHKLLHLTQAYG